MYTPPSFMKGVAVLLVLGIVIFFSGSGLVQSIRESLMTAFVPFADVSFFGLSDEERSEFARAKQRLKAIEFELDALRNENNELRAALGMSSRAGLSQLRGADVVRYGNELGEEFLIINRGEEHGVQEGDFAFDDYGLFVGSIRDVGVNTSTISLASNPGEITEVSLLPSGAQALATGIGARTLSLELVSATIPLRIGDGVFLPARNAAGPFLVGDIVAIRIEQNDIFQSVRATIAARPEQIEKVFLLHK